MRKLLRIHEWEEVFLKSRHGYVDVKGIKEIMGPEKLNGVGDMSLKVKERVSPEIINTKTIF